MNKRGEIISTLAIISLAVILFGTLAGVKNPLNLGSKAANKCTFKATNYVKDENGNFITEFDNQPDLYGTANNKQYDAFVAKGGFGKPTNTAGFENGQFYRGQVDSAGNKIHQTVTDNLTFFPTDPKAQYLKGEPASIKLYYNNDDFEIIRQECGGVGCPAATELNSTSTIRGINIDCGTDVSYGWILRRRYPAPAGQSPLGGATTTVEQPKVDRTFSLDVINKARPDGSNENMCWTAAANAIKNADIRFVNNKNGQYGKYDCLGGVSKIDRAVRWIESSYINRSDSPATLYYTTNLCDGTQLVDDTIKDEENKLPKCNTYVGGGIPTYEVGANQMLTCRWENPNFESVAGITAQCTVVPAPDISGEDAVSVETPSTPSDEVVSSDQVCTAAGASCNEDYQENCSVNGQSGRRWVHKINGVCDAAGDGTHCSWNGVDSRIDECQVGAAASSGGGSSSGGGNSGGGNSGGGSSNGSGSSINSTINKQSLAPGRVHGVITAVVPKDGSGNKLAITTGAYLDCTNSPTPCSGFKITKRDNGKDEWDYFMPLNANQSYSFRIRVNYYYPKSLIKNQQHVQQSIEKVSSLIVGPKTNHARNFTVMLPYPVN